MAAGNQLKKGHWALLVKTSRDSINIPTLEKLLETLKDLLTSQYLSKIISKASPNRFVKRVSKPPLAELQF